MAQKLAINWYYEFQFTPLREGRRALVSPNWYFLTYFNSRPSARGDPADDAAVPAVQSISIHAPPRGATARHPDSSVHPPYFNSRPSARGDIALLPLADDLVISIHAPPRGATEEVLRKAIACIFQFTPLREGRPVLRGERAEAEMISIHAPPRGATRPAWRTCRS